MTTDNHISRRKFIGAATAGVGAAIAAPLLPGSVLFPTAASAKGVSAASAAWEKPTGSLDVGVKATITSLSPVATQGYQWAQAVAYAMYEPLARRDRHGNLVPVLAESWENSDPKKTIIKVRRGVKFHNGAEMTAKDVAYSIAIRSDPALIKQSSSRPIMTPKQFVSSKAVDRYTVEVRSTSRVDANILYNDTQPLLVIPNGSFGKVNFESKEVGTGPFILSSFVSGSSLSTVANPHYWGAGPNLAKLDFHMFSDTATEAANLRSGEVNALYDVEPLYLAQVRNIPNTSVIPFGTYIDFWMPQMGKAPLNDVRVRRAIRYCFNKKLMNASSFGGLGKATWNPFNVTPIAGGIDAKASYDPDKARHLLKSIGKSGITVPLLGIQGYEDCQTQGQTIQQGLEAAGIKTSFKSLPLTQWLAETYTNGTWEGLAFNAGNVNFPYQDYLQNMVFPSSQLSAYTHGKAPNAAVNAIYNKVVAQPVSSHQEMRDIVTAERVLLDQAAIFFMFGGPTNLIVPKGLKGLALNGWGDVFWNTVTV